MQRTIRQHSYSDQSHRSKDTFFFLYVQFWKFQDNSESSLRKTHCMGRQWARPKHKQHPVQAKSPLVVMEGRAGTGQHSSQPSPTATHGRRNTTLKDTVTGRQWKGDQLQLRTLQTFKLQNFKVCTKRQFRVSLIMKYIRIFLFRYHTFQFFQFMS